MYKLGTVSYEHNGYLHKGVINHDAVKIVTFFDPKLGTKTFDNVIIDMGFGAFTHGQTYVALSRCRTLKGITLKSPISKSDIIFDERVYRFQRSLKDIKTGEKRDVESKEKKRPKKSGNNSSRRSR